MASLESLTNSLERLAVLPTTMSARKSAAGDITWNALVQYFANDVVISPLTGGAYLFTGGGSDAISVRGGSDPALSPDWTRLQGNGAAETAQTTISAVTGAANTYTFLAGSTLSGLQAGVYQIVAQGAVSTVAATAVGDVTTLIFTGGGGGSVFRLDVVPVADTASLITDFGASGVVTIGAGGSTITPTGSYTGAAPTLSATLTAIRIA